MRIGEVENLWRILGSKLVIQLLVSLLLYIYIYIYIYVCVCVCLCLNVAVAVAEMLFCYIWFVLFSTNYIIDIHTCSLARHKIMAFVSVADAAKRTTVSIISRDGK